jgi:hypothetical protein
MELYKKVSIALLLPAVFIYLGWLVVSAIRSGHAYFPRVGYYSRELRPKSFWALICLSLVLAAAFVVGWFFLMMEYLDNWK